MEREHDEWGERGRFARPKSWRVHACWRDEDCRVWDCPKRLYIFTPVGELILAWHREDWTQLWLPWKTTVPWHDKPVRYSRWWSPVVWHPKRRRSVH